jgi:hypothetical protein
MRITQLDKRRAISRLPEFKKDYASYKKIKDPNGKTLKMIELFKKWGYEIEAITIADAVAKTGRKDAPTVEAIERITDEPLTYIREEEKWTSLRGKSLYLKVDLNGKTETQLVADFKRTIKPYRDLLEAEIPEGTKKERTRKSDSFEDIWEVYDLYLDCGMNLNETTRRWFNVSGSPIHNWDESLLKQIKTAVNNAEAIIASVKKNIA